MTLRLARLATLGLSLLLMACGSARRSEPVAGPIEQQDAQLQRGHQVYDRHCHKCHTRGEAALGPALNNKPLPGFMIRFQVRRGLGSMPAFSEHQISDADLDALIAYLKALRGNAS